MPRRVVITGLGVVCALGGDVPALAAGLADGRCGIGPLTLFPHRGRCRSAAQVPEAVAVGALPPDLVRSPDKLGPGGEGRFLIAVNSGYGIQFNAASNAGPESVA